MDKHDPRRMYSMPTEAMTNTEAMPTEVVTYGPASNNVPQANISDALRAHGNLNTSNIR